jgi:hypothetical protein
MKETLNENLIANELLELLMIGWHAHIEVLPAKTWIEVSHYYHVAGCEPMSEQAFPGQSL